ncbi:putative membrane protein [Actinoplanes italicus]|uniref:Putative membrane protein n=2 Tax=Actinoplanes italicus TaxID=113567 RepID=A0A2T0JXC0_9ACTN|nr:putative membrane protein [Actinoplanes italicus]
MMPSMNIVRAFGQALLGTVLTFAGITHLTVARSEFQAQVPDWFPIDADFVVLASGVVEITLGVALLTVWKQPARGIVGAIAALFFVVIFPGNIAQWLEHKDGFGLDTDTKRFVRLFFQPLLVLWALAATRAIGTLRELRHRQRVSG